MLQDASEQVISEFGTQKVDKRQWNTEDSFAEMVKLHWDELTGPEQEEICLGMDEGLTEEQLKSLMLLPLEEMRGRRRGFGIENGVLYRNADNFYMY